MGCDPERVTGYVDGELTGAAAAETLRHLSICPACTAQARSEIDLRAILRFLPDPFPPSWLAHDLNETGRSLSIQ